MGNEVLVCPAASPAGSWLRQPFRVASMRSQEILVALCLFGVAAGPICAAAPLEAMLEVHLRGQWIEGCPLAWNSACVILLGRDGRLWSFAPAEVSAFRKPASGFRPYGPSELRGVLLRQLGPGYEVTGTGHYLVAHPAGQRDRWAERFEQLYRGFVRYFAVRGLVVQKPPFPLVGIVCRDRRDFQRHAAGQGLRPSQKIVGYYDNDSNRIVLFDPSGGDGRTGTEEDFSVVFHEAAHQVAFNTGVHSRLSLPPGWLAEGLATLFEVPAVWAGDPSGLPAGRVNRRRLADFRAAVLPQHRPELLEALVGGDELFQTATVAAYAEAWALSFYLCETRPAAFARYLARTARRDPFGRYERTQRLADFQAIFGADWRMLEAQMLRFMRQIGQ